MTTDEIRALLYRSYDAYNRGDRAFVMDLFDDEIEWVFFSPPEALPIANRVQGKNDVLMALRTIDEVIEHISTKLELVAVDGDCAATICDCTLRQRASGRTIRYKVAAFHRYRNGRLYSYTAFADGLDLVQQALGREIPVPSAYPR